MTHTNEFAIIGGGLAGLSSAYQLTQLHPTARITLYEKGEASSYNPEEDAVGRASLSASPARVMRLSSAGPGLGQWLVQETKAMLDGLQADMQADPASYPGLEGKKLLNPQASVIIGATKEEALYQNALQSLQTAGVAYEETDGATLKGRYPNLYKTLPDNAAVLVENPSGPENAAGVAGVMDVASTMQALTHYLRKRGVQIRTGETVQEVDQGSGHAVVKTQNEVGLYERAIIAPGQWIEAVIEAKNHGIEPRYDRVVILDIDLKALGLETPGIPFTRGLAPEGGKGSMYSFLPDASAGRLKFVPAATIRSMEEAAGLKTPITEDEKNAALSAAAVVLQVDKETLRQHAVPSLCAYTSPRLHENPLVANLSEDIVINGLDSSSTARTSAGLGKIAASLALGLEEPYPGAYQKYSLQAHHELVRQEPEISRQSFIERIWSNIQQAIGLQ